MKFGFIIKELRLTSPTHRAAIVVFKHGLNIISGPSNTGKTYIFQCLNYMLGGSKIPKKIKQAQQYSYCYLEIESSNGDVYTLKSDLVGGAFHLFSADLETSLEKAYYEVLKRNHDDVEQDNVSQFLLSLCNLKSKKLKTNADGKKRGLSFRDLVKFTMVEETKITTDKSPIVTGQYVTIPVEKSVFKFIVTGKDDSDIIEKLSAKEILHRKGKLEMLNDLINEIDKDLKKTNVTEFEQDQLPKLQKASEAVRANLANLNDINKQLNTRRNELYRSLSKEEEISMELSGVFERSQILGEQYDSDAARLVSTIETCELLFSGDTSIKECPVCHNGITIAMSEKDIESVLVACNTELKKIALLKKELLLSRQLISQDRARTDDNILRTNDELKNLERELEENVQSKIRSSLTELARMQAVEKQLTEYFQLTDRRTSLVASRDTIARSVLDKKKGSVDDTNLSSIVFPVTEQMYQILSDCHYPNLSGVSFNEDKMDFIISGEDRELTGKGYRAITYSSFVIGLQKHIMDLDYAIGVPILDSPFVTYRKPERGVGDDQIPVDLAMDFYRYLSSCNLPQIIVMENEEPPLEIESSINHIVFTQSYQHGRYGFIPDL
ncbi:MAG: AAA family ATPase [Bacteroidetes bacterium]|nr:AAA family ATPase [Bacteroidota bacterium]